jgi:hypothetical protein
MRKFPKSELAAAMYQRLSDPRCWTKHTSARDRDGQSVPPSSHLAQSWCLTGAATYELHRRGYQSDCITNRLYADMTAIFKEQYPEIRACGVQGFNDDHRMTHEGLLAVLQKTYNKLVERGE